MYTYLTMTVGQNAGASYLLNDSSENKIGRDSDCAVTLSDALCSRVHAVVERRDGAWILRDVQSRNGTFVNGQKVDEATLGEGHFVRVGSTEFTFHQSSSPPPVGPINSAGITQTVVKEANVGSFDSSGQFAMNALRDPEQTHDLLLLYQLCIKLLATTDPQELLRVGLDLLRTRTDASVVGYLWLDDNGRLKSKVVVPERTQRVELSEALTKLVCEKGNAVWIADERPTGRTGEELEHYADALCVPLVYKTQCLGAIHVYLERGRFRQAQFDFAISVASISAVALSRTLRQESLETDFRRLKDKSPGYDELIGDCPAMLELKSKITRLGKAAGVVLVRGESGTGKELVARALHRASARAHRPLLAVNCAAIPSELVDSQLFGHKAGAFTGADRDHIGFFQQADLGTLFLDEIGELGLPAQAKLLRILEGHPFLPVGGKQEVQVDVRVIAATNRDLLTFVQEKKFREDLYYRLNVFEVVLPPLRERGGDIGTLIDYFLAHFTRLHGRPGLALSTEARQRLLAYNWPGNVRQLRNVLDSAVVLADGDEIRLKDLGLREAGALDSETLRIEDWERRLIMEALRRTGDSIPEASKLLNIGRATLYRKIEEYHINRGA